MQPSVHMMRPSLGLAAFLVIAAGGPEVPDLSAARQPREPRPPIVCPAGGTLVQRAYLKASNTEAHDRFGDSVAVSGDTVVIGAALESSGATGVNGDQTDNSAQGAGAVYVFVRSSTGWKQQAYLKASNTESGDQFGQAVALSGDTLVVGAYGEDSAAVGVNGDESDNSLVRAGAAYVFVRDGTTWIQEAYLKASNTGDDDRFGVTVAIDGDTIVVGSNFEDSAAVGVNGDETNDDAERSGAAYVYERSGTVWSQVAYLKASNTDADDRFGRRVAVSGDTIVVGAWFEDSDAVGVNGDQGNASSSFDAGAAYVFVRDGADWSQEAYLKASNTGRYDSFGYWVAASGDTIVVGARSEDSASTGVNGNQDDNSSSDSGAAYVFTRTGTSWSQEAYLKASNTGEGDVFGHVVAVRGNTIAVAAYLEDSNATGVNGHQHNDDSSWAGAAYVFGRDGTGWCQEAYLKASNTDLYDSFGWTLDLGRDALVVGSLSEDSSATGVNGDQTDNSADLAGAAYLFEPLPAGCVLLDFETEDDFITTLVNGQDVSTPPEFGNLVAIGAATISQGPAIFDTDPYGPNQGPPFHDPDLLVGLGNALVFQEVPGQTVPGIFDDPDDSSAGGTFFFDFLQPLEVRGLDLIDIDLYPLPQDAWVTLIDASSRLRVYHAPSGWTEDLTIDGAPGFRRLDTTTLSDQPGFASTATATEDPGFDPTRVVRMEVFLSSSGALDEIELCTGEELRPRMVRQRFPAPYRRPRR